MTFRTLEGIALGLLISLLDPFARVAVICLAPFGWYPQALSTPDETKPPYGLYEPSQVRAYFGAAPLHVSEPTYWRRVWGDICWLAGRNVLFGLSYRFKPRELYFSSLGVVPGTVSVVERGRVTKYTFGEFVQYTIRLLPKFGIQMGWKVDGYLHQLEAAGWNKEPSMQGRPIFSIRKLG